MVSNHEMFHIHFSFHYLNFTKITHTSSFWILFVLINKMKVWRCILTLLTYYSQTARINNIIMHVSLLPCFNSFFFCFHYLDLAPGHLHVWYWVSGCGWCFCIGYWVDGLCWVLWRRRSIQYIGWCCPSIRKFFL